MGNKLTGCKKIKNSSSLEEENVNLKKEILKQNSILNDQMYMIQLLKHKETADVFIKDGVCSKLDEDSTLLIEDTRKNKDYEYVVFSGGGIKGISYCGAIQTLEEMNILYNEDGSLKLKGIAGTSAGSIAATLLALNYKSNEINDIINSLNMDDIFDDKIGFIRDTINLFVDYGVAPGNYIYKILGDLIELKTGNKDYTLDQLYKDKNIKLVLVGTDLNTESSRYFCHNSALEQDRSISIRKAVRISMSIPFMFEPVKHDGDYCVDGGQLDNYPLHVFDGDYPGELKARLNLCPPNPKVLGVNIINDTELESYAVVRRQEINNPIEYSMAFISTFLSENERRIMTPSYWLRTINIITPNYSIREFNLSASQKTDLIERGCKYVTKFFEEEK